MRKTTKEYRSVESVLIYLNKYFKIEKGVQSFAFFKYWHA